MHGRTGQCVSFYGPISGRKSNHESLDPDYRAAEGDSTLDMLDLQANISFFAFHDLR